MIVNQTGGGNKLTKGAKTFRDAHASGTLDRLRTHFDISKAVQPGEFVIAYGYIKVYAKEYTDNVAPTTGEIYSGSYAVYVNGDLRTPDGRQISYGGTSGGDPNDYSKYVHLDIAAPPIALGLAVRLEFDTAGGLANSSPGTIYVSRNEVWLTK